MSKAHPTKEQLRKHVVKNNNPTRPVSQGLADSGPAKTAQMVSVEAVCEDDIEDVLRYPLSSRKLAKHINETARLKGYSGSIISYFAITKWRNDRGIKAVKVG